MSYNIIEVRFDSSRLVLKHTQIRTKLVEFAPAKVALNTHRKPRLKRQLRSYDLFSIVLIITSLFLQDKPGVFYCFNDPLKGKI